MRDYAELIKDARYCCISGDCVFCNRKGLAENWRLCQDRLLNDSADAIEELLAKVRSVVHCKDCKWCHAGYCEKYDDLIPFGCANKPWEDWFCADGKRREIIKEEQDAD